MISNDIILLIFSYIGVFELMNITNVNKSILNRYYSSEYIKIIKDNYKIFFNIHKILKSLYCFNFKECIICNKKIDCNKIMLIQNILPCEGKCFLCLNYNCTCVLYIYAHLFCLTKFELKKLNDNVNVYLIPNISEHIINGLIIK